MIAGANRERVKQQTRLFREGRPPAGCEQLPPLMACPLTQLNGEEDSTLTLLRRVGLTQPVRNGKGAVSLRPALSQSATLTRRYRVTVLTSFPVQLGLGV